MLACGQAEEFGEAGQNPALSRNRGRSIVGNVGALHKSEHRPSVAPMNPSWDAGPEQSPRGLLPRSFPRLDERILVRAPSRALATLVVVVALVLAACQPAPSPEVVRDRGTAWLVNQFGDDGIIAVSFDPNRDDLGGTAFAVTNLASARVGAATARRSAEALADRVDEYVVDGAGADRPGSLARLILAAEATGMSSRDFGGANLVSRLQATMRRTGPDRGLFGSQSPTYDGAFRQGLALAALSLVRPHPVALRRGAGSIDDVPAVAWLRGQQCDDGSWTPYRSDVNAPCAFDPVLYTGSDTNSTALAVLGLQAVDATSVTGAEPWLAGVRSDDGGWSFNGGAETEADPDSTGLVLGALRALGTPGDEPAFTRLSEFQFGPDAPGADRGAFFFPAFDDSPRTVNLLATNDALLGLAPGVWPEVIEP